MVHQIPINFPENLSEEQLKSYTDLPAAGILSGEHSGRKGRQISLSVLVNGVGIVVAQIPYTEGNDQVLLAQLFQIGADFLRTSDPIKPPKK